MDRAMGTFGPVHFPIFPPSDWEGGAPELPEDMVVPELAYVQGFNAACRPAVVFVDAHRAALAAGKLIVVMDLSDRSQRFIRGHSDAVSCIAYSPEQRLGASGQVRRRGAKFAEVVMWCPDTLRRCTTYGFHQDDIEAVGFVQGGELLVSIGSDRDRTLALWPAAKEGYFSHRRREGPLAVCSAYKSGLVHGIVAAPEVQDAPTQFATFGTNHVKFWRSDRLAPSLDGRRGSFGSDGPPRSVVAVAWASPTRLVAGGCDGDIYFFEETRAVRKLTPHRYPPALLVPLQGALLTVYSTGVCALLHGKESIDFDISGMPGAPDKRLQSPVVGGAVWDQSSVLLATRTHLLRLAIGSGPDQLRSCETLLVQASRPLTAVCDHPVDALVYTSSLDGCVRCYRTDNHRAVADRSFRASAGVTCLAVSGCPLGASAWLAVGCEDRTLSVMSETSLRYVFRRCLTSKRVKLTCARFSTCDASGANPMWLAVGTDDGCIHTFCFKDPLCRDALAHTGAETVTRAATLQGHAAPVVDISFADTLPCVFLLSVDAAGQALAFDVPMARRLPSVAMVRDVPFAPWTSPIGWQVAGCWSSPQQSLAATSELGSPAPARLGGSGGGAGLRSPASTLGRSSGGSSIAGVPAASRRARSACNSRPASAASRPPSAAALLPARRFCEVAGHHIVAATTAGVGHEGGCDIELYPFPCPSPPENQGQPVPRLAGPAAPVASLAHGRFTDCLLGASDTALFVWNFGSRGSRPGSAEVARGSPFAGAAFAGSPLRPTKQAVANLETPEGRKKLIFAADGNDGLAFTPQPRTPLRSHYVQGRPPAQAAKENQHTPLTKAGGVGDVLGPAKQQHGPPPCESPPAAGTPPPSAGLSQQVGEAPPAAVVDAVPSPGFLDESPYPEVAPLPGGGFSAGAAYGQRWGGRPAGRCSSAPSGRQPGNYHRSPQQPRGLPDRDLGFGEVRGGAALRSPPPASRSPGMPMSAATPGDRRRSRDVAQDYLDDETRRVHEDTEARARRVHERQAFDSVGPLLGGGPYYETEAASYAPARPGPYRDTAGGGFVYRARDVGDAYEVEAQLPRGRILQVLRNPFRRTLSFEGEVDRQAERLVVQLPPGFDVEGPPLRIERNFSEGHCLVAVARSGFGASGARAVVGYGDGES
eukprot:TRINITY_DN31220_c0_g1_i1.p1 TRINITY_DN31220_c0_g1~~TRINITY_DN31220_c0_g1_i1.p1  ORF type:complete len:1199 (+),score=176.21 TRINITY_DN31220_c0_g1_i1:128-3598(+)